LSHRTDAIRPTHKSFCQDILVPINPLSTPGS
jgi:hypothetical protein